MAQKVLDFLKDWNRQISYRPLLANALGDHRAAILFQQIGFWTDTKDGGAFYKFKQPCKHPLYKDRDGDDGDSWCEELAFSRYDFDTAIGLIGTKITKGDSKAEAFKIKEIPEPIDGETVSSYLERLEEAYRHLVIYWTDSDRVTWYQVNHPLLEDFINKLRLGKAKMQRYLVKLNPDFTYVKQESDFTCNSEITDKETLIDEQEPRSFAPKAITTINVVDSLPESEREKELIPEKPEQSFFDDMHNQLKQAGIGGARFKDRLQKLIDQYTDEQVRAAVTESIGESAQYITYVEKKLREHGVSVTQPIKFPDQQPDKLSIPPMQHKAKKDLKGDIAEMITPAITHAVMGQWVYTRNNAIKRNPMVSYDDTHLVHIELNDTGIEIQVTCNPANLNYLESDQGIRHIQTEIIRAVIFSGDYSPNRNDYTVRFIPVDDWQVMYENAQEAS